MTSWPCGLDRYEELVTLEKLRVSCCAMDWLKDLVLADAVLLVQTLLVLPA